MDSTVTLYALRYAMKRNAIALSRVAKYITENIHEISNSDLVQMKHELTGYYEKNRDNDNYLIAKKLCVAINRELYSEE